jgi:hypothetical protein
VFWIAPESLQNRLVNRMRFLELTVANIVSFSFAHSEMDLPLNMLPSRRGCDSKCFIRHTNGSADMILRKGEEVGSPAVKMDEDLVPVSDTDDVVVFMHMGMWFLWPHSTTNTQ